MRLDVSATIHQEQRQIRPVIRRYHSVIVSSLWPYTEVIHVPLFYGTFEELHQRFKPFSPSSP